MRRAPRRPPRRVRRPRNLREMPPPAPFYRTERIGEHSDVVEVRIGGDVFRLNLAATIEQLIEISPPRRSSPAPVLPFKRT